MPVLSGDVFLCFFYSRTNKTQCSFIALVSVTLWALEATQAPSLGGTNPQVCTSSCFSPFWKLFYSSLNPFVFPRLFFMLLYFLQKQSLIYIHFFWHFSGLRDHATILEISSRWLKMLVYHLQKRKENKRNSIYIFIEIYINWGPFKKKRIYKKKKKSTQEE